MNISKTMISVALSAMLLVQGCGGGGGSAGGDGTPSTELGNVQVPANSEERTALYNEKVAEFSDQAAKVRRELDSMLSDVSHNYSVMPEDIATDDYDRFRTRMNAALPDYAKLLLLANDVATIESQMAADVTRKAQPRFILTSILVTSVVVGMAGMYKWAIDSNNERIHIIVKAIANANPRELEEYNDALGIDRKSSKQEALSKFNNLGFRQAVAMVKRMESVINVNIAQGSDDKYATQLKDQSVKTVEKAAAVAVTTVIGQVLTAAGGQGVDKAISGAARLLGASAADAALIGATADLVISAEGKAPLDIIANNITVVEQAKEWYEENVEAGKKMVQDALTIIQKVAEGDIPDALGIGDLVDSANSMMQNVVMKSGQGEKNPDGSVTVKVPYRKSITTVKKVKNEDTKIPVSQMSDANIIVVAEGKKPEIKEDVSVVGETTIEVEAKELKVVQKDMTVNASKVSSDQDSITYNVTATLTGVTEPTMVKISLSNASTGSSSKTLTKDGAVSWTVTVLDKDASVTVTRMDTGASSYLQLKGQTQYALAGTINGSWAGKDSEGDRVSGSFVMHISAAGGVKGTYSGDDKGSLSGTISSNGALDAKSGGGALDAGRWSGTVHRNKDGSLTGSGSWSGQGYSGGWSGAGS